MRHGTTPLLTATRPWWAAAASIVERASVHPGGAAGVATPSDLTQFRLDSWCAQPPFHDTSWFERRLAQWGIDRSRLEYLISEEALRPSSIDNSAPPSWAARIDRLYEADRTGGGGISVATETASGTTQRLLTLVRPLTSEALHRVTEALLRCRADRALPHIDIDGVVTSLSRSLNSVVMPAIARVCALELNVRSVEGRLAGASPAERFTTFIDELASPAAAAAFLRDYPVLARHLVTLVDDWTAGTEEWLRRLQSDFDDLRGAFPEVEDSSAVVRVETTGGDRHHGGRTPVVLVFDSGHRLVYKPRSLSLDQHFADLIGWLNAQGLNPELRTVRVMDRGTYGWCEFVEHRPCVSAGQIEDFYRRQGAYLAVFYALGSSDFHRENIIAHGQHPVPVDLETLFCPEQEYDSDQRAPGLAHRAIAASVLRVGLLPRRVWGSDPWNGIDLSGLAGDAAQQTPFGVLTWSAPIGDDDLRLVRRPIPLAPAINRPVFDGEPIAVADHVPLVVEGFERAYALLQRLRPSLCATDGPLSAFRNDEIRVVLRPTRTYSALLQETYHPDYLQDAADRDRLLDLLWATVPYAEHLSATVGFEQEDLRAGDVPRFTCQASGTTPWAGPGRQVPVQFSKSGLDVAASRIERLNDEDLARQSWLVKAALATAARDPEQGWARYTFEPAATDAGTIRLRAGELAAAIGDRLATLAYYGEHDLTWIGLTVSNDERWTVCPVRTSVYDGLAGIALFFGYLGTVRNEERFKRLARRIAASVAASWRVESGAPPSIGAFSGLGGLIYVFTHLAQLLDDEELLTAAQQMVGELPVLIPRDREFDIIGGAAGCIGGLLSLWQCAPADEVMAQAVACGQHLVATATEYPRGCGWVRPEMGPSALAGFAHGAAGIAWALDKLAAATGIDVFANCANSAIEYERTLFSERMDNWRDVRDSGSSGAAREAPVKFSTAWCHGAPGIGLARLAMLRRTPDPALHRELEAAVRSTRRGGFGLNHSLCHGDLGNLELLMQTAQLPEFVDTAEPFATAAAGIVEDIDRQGPRCGIPLQVESPGLMTGLAGIGLGLLRIAAADRTPCVPMLDPPRTPHFPRAPVDEGAGPDL